MKFFTALKEKIKTSPALRAVISVGSVIVTGILCGTFVTEITINSNLNWKLAYKAKSTYLLIFYGILYYVYIKYIYIQEKTILNYLDDDYCLAYFRSEALPELVQKYKEDMKKGKKMDKFKPYHKELEKILRSKKNK